MAAVLPSNSKPRSQWPQTIEAGFLRQTMLLGMFDQRCNAGIGPFPLHNEATSDNQMNIMYISDILTELAKYIYGNDSSS